MKRKFIPLLVILPLFLAGCSLFSNLKANQPLSDAEMATRVAELLSTMTTPTTEFVFPPTYTPGAPIPTITPEMITLSSPTATLEVGGEPQSTPTAVILIPTAQNSPTPEELLQPSATATAQGPSSDPVNTLGNPTSSDPMDTNTKWTWPTGSDDYINVEFKDGYMLMTNLNKDSAGWRLPLVDQQINTYIEMTVNSGACSNKDSYGIIFRVPVFKVPDQGYLFQVTCDGYYRLWKWNGKSGDKGEATSLINWKSSDKINVGPNQSNRLGVMVKNNTYTVYVNGHELGSASDTSYAAGFFGAFVRSGGDTHYTAKMDAMRYWVNP